MKKEFWGFTALGFMLTALLLAAVPAGAQSVDDKIKALEQELGAAQVAADRAKERVHGSGRGVAEF